MLQLIDVPQAREVKVEVDRFDRRRCAGMGGKERKKVVLEVPQHVVLLEGGAQLEGAQRGKIGETDVAREGLIYF